MNLQPVLEDDLVLLRPLHENDFEALYEVASDKQIWEQHPAKERSEREGFTRYFEEALATARALAIIDKDTHKIIGTSRYNPSRESERAIEIGWTFLAKKYWGGKYNSAVKTLMIRYAFLYFDTVLFYVDKDNLRSQKAVEKIGGKRVTEIKGVPIAPRNSSVFYAIYRPEEDSAVPEYPA